MATFNFNKVNLAAAQIPSAITASQTSITVDASESALFPTVPFFATIMPAGGVPNTLNSEIVQVTAVNTSTGVLTITRAQRSTTAKAQDEGAVIMNGVYIEDLAQAQAVGLAFFSATNVSVSSSYSYWNIDNAMLPTAPTNGMSIRVVFGADTSGPAAQLRLNGGTYHNVYAGVGLTATASNVNTTTPFNPKSGIIYELVYYNNAWYAMNVPANNSITSDNVDWTTLRKVLYDGDSGTSGYVYLSESAANFDYLIIQFYRKNDTSTFCSTVVYSPNNRSVTLNTSAAVNDTYTLYACRISISGATITINSGSAVAFRSSGMVGYGNGNEIKIAQVIGIRS